jgi:beta-lactamase superfamily II metal-dependent hydrolase
MLFSLEALNAKHGDALILHLGEPNAPETAVVDGGPSGVFRAVLRPRLDALVATRGVDGTLPIKLLMASHVDDDHVRGVLDLAEHVEKERASTGGSSYRVGTLWHNAFEDLVKAAGGAGATSFAAALSAAKPRPGTEAAAVAASAAQGVRLAAKARALGWSVNRPFDGFVEAGGAKAPKPTIGKTKLIVVGPRAKELAALEEGWRKALAAARKKKKSASVAAADYLDASVYNLSSLCVLLKRGRKSMLLTGDVRGDVLLEGLAAAKLLKKGRLHVDLLKVPHHGSDRNVERGFFEALTADHYVISADGKHGNPDVATLKMIVEARGAARYALHFTNAVPKVDAYLKKEAKRRNFAVFTRRAKEPSIRIDLGLPPRD